MCAPLQEVWAATLLLCWIAGLTPDTLQGSVFGEADQHWPVQGRAGLRLRLHRARGAALPALLHRRWGQRHGGRRHAALRDLRAHAHAPPLPAGVLWSLCTLPPLPSCDTKTLAWTSLNSCLAFCAKASESLIRSSSCPHAAGRTAHFLWSLGHRHPGHTSAQPAPDLQEAEIRLQAARGGKAPVISAVVAGGCSSAFLTRAPDEIPNTSPPQLWEKCACLLHPAACLPLEACLEQLAATQV